MKLSMSPDRGPAVVLWRNQTVNQTAPQLDAVIGLTDHLRGATLEIKRANQVDPEVIVI
jgi:hypothetical protein